MLGQMHLATEPIKLWHWSRREMVTSIDTVHRLDHLVVGFTWHGLVLKYCSSSNKLW